MQDTLFIVALVLIACIVPSYVTYRLISSFIQNYLDKTLAIKRQEALLEKKKEFSPVKLQAYERLTLLLERISPDQLIHRLSDAQQPAAALHISILMSVRAEFEHNLAQQIYVSEGLWNQIVKAKEEVLSITNESYRNLPETASAFDLARQMLQYSNPCQAVLQSLKVEIGSILS